MATPRANTGTKPGMSKRKRARVAEAEAAVDAVRDILLPFEGGALETEGMERTYRVSQREIKESVDEQASRKAFDFKLDTFGPYRARYGRSGRHLLICGGKGHVAAVDWQRSSILTELHLKETCRDGLFLHNQTMFAVAQKRHLFIYDDGGVELHCLRNHVEVNRLEFLPFHFLLVSVGRAGWLKYQDISTGELVAELRTRLGDCKTMSHNPYNAVVGLGHSRGTVTMWTPNMSTPVVRMLCHHSPVQALAFDQEGKYMVTAGLDAQIKVWDVRTYRELHAYFSYTPPSDVAISQRGLLGVCHGIRLEVWKDALRTKVGAPYITHTLGGGCVSQSLDFCPYEDVAVVGHAKGITSVLVPGAGEPNLDSMAANPYETSKQRKETEVHQLLDKIQPDMITLNPGSILKINRSVEEVAEEERAGNKVKVEKHRTRGRNRAIKRLRKKQTSIVDTQRDALRAKRLAELEAEKAGEEQQGKSSKSPEMEKPKKAKGVLDRFRKRKA